MSRVKAQSDSDVIESLTLKVTAPWAKQKKAEERHERARFRRDTIWAPRITIKDVVEQEMERAYLAASANNTLPANARQIYYQIRAPVEKQTGKPLDANYFTQTLLKDYLNERDDLDWDVVYDDRGHLIEPHGDQRMIGLGTLSVRKHLQEATGPSLTPVTLADPELRVAGPEEHYGAILFIEKEGFMPLFEQVQLAQRYDIAIMSTKGLSNAAARRLADELCGKHDIPLLVLHDFDKAGFSIAGTLQRDTRSYRFENEIKVVDLGIRLEDIRRYNLAFEDYMPKGEEWTVHQNLEENGATEEEIEILLSQRVELNAFTSDQFIAWIEGKLEGHGVKKVIPQNDSLGALYAQAAAACVLQDDDEIQTLIDDAVEEHKAPQNLRKRVREYLRDHREKSWHEGVIELARNDVENA